jgi:hypothetical protein
MNGARMTDIEADVLDEKWTANPPKAGANGTGFFARRKEVMEYIEESKRLGRPLTLEEMDKYEKVK